MQWPNEDKIIVCKTLHRNTKILHSNRNSSHGQEDKTSKYRNIFCKSLVVNTFWSFPHLWLITWFVNRVTLWVPLVEQELLTLAEHMRSPPVFSRVRVNLSLVLCVVFVPLFFFFSPVCCLSFHLRILMTSLVSSNSSCLDIFEWLLYEEEIVYTLYSK
jgi:hypothetical protein